MSDEHYFTASPASEEERRAIRVILAGRDVPVETASGVFSHGHLDLGTEVLLRNTPPPPPGELLDLGCGWGPITLAMALLQPKSRVWAVDVNERALDLTRANAERLAQHLPMGEVIARTPDQMPADMRFDAIWSNPPIRIGKDALHGLLGEWLLRLKWGMDAHLVVQRNLGSDSLGKWLGEQVEQDGQRWGIVKRVSSDKGFRVLKFSRV